MNGVFSIRLAQDADAPRIAVMSRDLIETGLRWGWTPHRVRRHIHDKSSNVIIAEHEGRHVGGFAIMRYGTDQAHLLLFAVEPELRGNGIGTGLLSWLEMTAGMAGIELIFLEVRAGNSGGRAFYRRRGYRELNRIARYYGGQEDAIRVGKDLALAPPCTDIRSS